jgi:putative colanic acid biosynthesis acetyltransferase WcaF
MADLDIADNRRATKYSRKVQVMRVLWEYFGQPLFHCIPRPLFGVRAALLRAFGARVGRNVNIHPNARIEMPWNLEIGDWSAIGDSAFIYSLGPITIGQRATVSHRAHLCAGTHDYRDPALPLLRPPIVIGDQVWVCAEAFIGPNVTVGEGAVVGAAAVVMKDVGPWDVVSGNPATVAKKRVLKTAE